MAKKVVYKNIIFGINNEGAHSLFLLNDIQREQFGVSFNNVYFLAFLYFYIHCVISLSLKKNCKKKK